MGRIWLIGKGDNGKVGPAITLGRGPRNDLVVNEYSVSRHHLSFRNNPTGVQVIDMRSRNGTFVNNQRLVPGKPYCLASNDTLIVGRIVCTFLNRKEFLECMAVMGRPRSVQTI